MNYKDFLRFKWRIERVKNIWMLYGLRMIKDIEMIKCFERYKGLKRSI